MADKIGSIYYELDLDDGKFKSGLDKASSQIQSIGTGLKDFGANLTTKITLPIAAFGTLAIKQTADLQDALGATDQIFNESAETVKNWADNLSTAYGIAEGEALQYANMMGSMLQNIGGLTEDEAAKQAQTLIELAGDLTAMYGGTTQDAVRALTGSLKGNNTMLDNYGMAVNDAMIKTKAFEMGLYSGNGELSLQAKQGATLALIMEQTGAAQGQAAREADGASGSFRSLSTEIKNMATDFGELFLPLVTELVQKLKSVLAVLSNLDDGQKKAVLLFLGIAAAIGPLLVILGTFVGAIGNLIPLFGLLASPIGIAVAAIGAIIAAIVLLQQKFGILNPVIDIFQKAWVYISYALQQAWNQIQTVANSVSQRLQPVLEQIRPSIEKMQDAFAKLEPLFKVIGGVVVVALIAAFEALMLAIEVLASVFAKVIPPIADIFANTFDWIGNAVQAFVALLQGDWDKVFEYSKKMAENVVNVLKGGFELVLGLVVGLVEGVISWFNNLYMALVGGSIIPDMVNGILLWVSNLVTNFTSFISNLVTSVVSMVAAFASNIVSTIQSGLSGLYNIGVQTIQGFYNGIRDKLTEVVGMVSKKINDIKNKFKEALKLRSPSKVMEHIGLMIGEGLQNGIDKSMNNIDLGFLDSIKGLNSSMKIEAGASIAPRPVVVNLNPQGIIAYSRSQLRTITADMIESVNEHLRANNIDEIGGGRLNTLINH